MADVESMSQNSDAVAGNSSPAVDPAIILLPNDLPAVPSLVARISTLGAAFAGSSVDNSARQALLNTARSLVRALEKPRETMIRHTWADQCASSAICIGVETGVWAYMAKDGEPKTVRDIAAATGVDESFLARLLRHVAAMGYIREVGQDVYRPTNFSNSLAIPIIGDGYPLFRAVGSLPVFAKKGGYTTPVGNFQFANSTTLNLFEWMAVNPQVGLYFNNHMGGYSYGRPSWMDVGFYPVNERLLQGFSADNTSDDGGDGKGPALLVDIGGGLGHDIEEFWKKFPEVKGRLVLQDLNTVIGQIQQLDERIERMSYDFNTEQPVKGARAYYMHSILHDWPDEVCISILANVKAAMRPGFTRLLINENVIPDTEAQWEATGLDLVLLSMLSARERTRVDWFKLLEDGAGLKVEKVYTYANGVESLIECVLPEEAV